MQVSHSNPAGPSTVVRRTRAPMEGSSQWEGELGGVRGHWRRKHNVSLAYTKMQTMVQNAVVVVDNCMRDLSEQEKSQIQRYGPIDFWMACVIGQPNEQEFLLHIDTFYPIQ